MRKSVPKTKHQVSAQLLLTLLAELREDTLTQIKELTEMAQTAEMQVFLTKIEMARNNKLFAQKTIETKYVNIKVTNHCEFL